MKALRRSMIERMQLRSYAESTIEGYVHSVAQLARYYGRSPELLEEEEVRQYLLPVVTVKKAARGSFSVVLGEPAVFEQPWTVQLQHAGDGGGRLVRRFACHLSFAIPEPFVAPARPPP